MNSDVLEMACRPLDSCLRTPDAAVGMREHVAPVAAGTADRALGDDIDPQPSSRGFIAMLEAYRATGGLAPGNFLKQSLQEHQRGDLASWPD